MANTPADQLRTRATTLRAFATQLRGLDALDLVRRAGADTWLGPSAEQCRAELLGARRELQRAGDEVLIAAHRLERRAADLDATVPLRTS